MAVDNVMGGAPSSFNVPNSSLFPLVILNYTIIDSLVPVG